VIVDVSWLRLELNEFPEIPEGDPVVLVDFDVCTNCDNTHCMACRMRDWYADGPSGHECDAHICDFCNGHLYGRVVAIGKAGPCVSDHHRTVTDVRFRGPTGTHERVQVGDRVVVMRDGAVLLEAEATT
jgi:hypothetical protein